MVSGSLHPGGSASGSSFGTVGFRDFFLGEALVAGYPVGSWCSDAVLVGFGDLESSEPSNSVVFGSDRALGASIPKPRFRQAMIWDA